MQHAALVVAAKAAHQQASIPLDALAYIDIHFVPDAQKPQYAAPLQCSVSRYLVDATSGVVVVETVRIEAAEATTFYAMLMQRLADALASMPQDIRPRALLRYFSRPDAGEGTVRAVREIASQSHMRVPLEVLDETWSAPLRAIAAPGTSPARPAPQGNAQPGPVAGTGETGKGGKPGSGCLPSWMYLGGLALAFFVGRSSAAKD